MRDKKTILVTGGLGYIGSHTVVELIQSGFNVVVIDNLSNSRIEILEQIEKITETSPKFYEVELLNNSLIAEIFSKEKIDGVIHFAAHLLVDESVMNPIKYYKNNLGSLLNVLENVEIYGVNNLIFSSSCTVYGNPKSFPVDENTPIREASSPYGTTKIFGEKIIRDTVLSSKSLNAISLRYFNPAGAHASGLIGELTNEKPAHLFPILAEAFRKKNPFRIFGKDYNTHDGTPIRDYIHVVDLAKAHVLALNYQFEGRNSKGFDSYNIGTGKGLSVLEIINEFEKKSGNKIEMIFENRREGDVEEIWAEPVKANKKLKWQPENKLEDMVSSSIKWDKYQIEKGWS